MTSRCLLPVAGLVLLMGCGGGAVEVPAGDVIDRETFIVTYVDLRMEALDNTPQVLTPGERDSILAEHGVTDADMKAFAESHAQDLEYMRDVWADAESRILSILSPDGTAEAEEPMSTTRPRDVTGNRP